MLGTAGTAAPIEASARARAVEQARSGPTALLLRMRDAAATPVGERHLRDRAAASKSCPRAPRSKGAVDLRWRSLSWDGLRLGLHGGCNCSTVSLLCLLRLEVRLADLCSDSSTISLLCLLRLEVRLADPCNDLSTVSLLCLLRRDARLADLSACGDTVSSGLCRRSLWAGWYLERSNDEVDECRRGRRACGAIVCFARALCAHRNRWSVSGGFYGPRAMVSLGRRRRATGRQEKCFLHAPRKRNGQK